MFWPFSDSEGLRGPLRVPNGIQWTTWCAMRSRDRIFYCGIISLWENWVFLTQKVNKEMIWCIFIRFQALRAPQRAPEGPQWFPMDSLICPEKLRWIINYGMVSLWENWTGILFTILLKLRQWNVKKCLNMLDMGPNKNVFSITNVWIKVKLQLPIHFFNN